MPSTPSLKPSAENSSGAHGTDASEAAAAAPRQGLDQPVLPNAVQLDTQTLKLLDDQRQWQTFSQLDTKGVQNGQWVSHIRISGMYCAACSLTIERALKNVHGVMTAQVSAASERARVVWLEYQTSPSQWLGAVQAKGYGVMPAHEGFEREAQRKQERQALWRMLVAVLCMMQVMMYAYPSYIGRSSGLTLEYEQLLRWASWVLSLPVLFFSCTTFFQNAWRDLKHRQIGMDLPISLGVLIMFTVSTLGTFEPKGVWGQEVYFDSLTMFVSFLLFGRWLETRVRNRTVQSLEQLLSRLPQAATRVLPSGDTQTVPVYQVQVGDVLQVTPGQAFVADGVIVQGETSVDEALLTGESKPQVRTVGQRVVTGSFNTQSLILMQVEQVGEQTQYAKMVALMQQAATSKPRVALLADRVVKPFLITILILAALAAAFWWKDGALHALMVAASVLVVTCPCALSLATPAAMLTSAGALAQRGILIPHLQVFEPLSAIDTVLFDKTGTLTHDVLTLVQIHERPIARNKIKLLNKDNNFDNAFILFLASMLAQHSQHPVSKAIVQAARARPIVNDPTLGNNYKVVDVKEIAGIGLQGNLLRKGLNSFAQGILQKSDNASDVYENLGQIRLGSDVFCHAQGLETGNVQTHLAYTPPETMGDDAGVALATFELCAPLREDAKNTIETLKKQGIQVQIVSGDKEQAVEQIAREVAIADFRSQCRPEEKLEYLQNLQKQGRVCAVVGDGFNDAPILAAANASFALGKALELTRAKADVALLSNKIMDVWVTVNVAKKTQSVIRQNLSWAIFYNLTCVPLALLGYLPAWLAGLGMAMSSLIVILNALRLRKIK